MLPAAVLVNNSRLKLPPKVKTTRASQEHPNMLPEGQALEGKIHFVRHSNISDEGASMELLQEGLAH